MASDAPQRVDLSLYLAKEIDCRCPLRSRQDTAQLVLTVQSWMVGVDVVMDMEHEVKAARSGRIILSPERYHLCGDGCYVDRHLNSPILS